MASRAKALARRICRETDRMNPREFRRFLAEAKGAQTLGDVSLALDSQSRAAGERADDGIRSGGCGCDGGGVVYVVEVVRVRGQYDTVRRARQCACVQGDPVKAKRLYGRQ
jgi:hypothetical protein